MSEPDLEDIAILGHALKASPFALTPAQVAALSVARLASPDVVGYDQVRRFINDGLGKRVSIGLVFGTCQSLATLGLLNKIPEPRLSPGRRRETFSITRRGESALDAAMALAKLLGEGP